MLTIAQLNQAPSEVVDFTRAIKISLRPQTSCVAMADVKWPKGRFTVVDLASHNQISHTDASFVLAEAQEAGVVKSLDGGWWCVKN